MLAIIEKRIFLNVRPTGIAVGRREMDQSRDCGDRRSRTGIRSPSVRRRRRGDRHGTLICHGRLRRPLSIALLTTAMGFPARFALLVATVSVMSLLLPHFRTAFRAAVALAPVAADADCERLEAGRVAAKPKAQNSVPANIHLSHSENYAIRIV